MYSKYFQINKNFQSSVNLELDLNNVNKIEEYIPTTDICDVLKYYVKNALGLSKDKATTLIGPYGKGKSFLLLILTFIFGKQKRTSTWIKFLDKIKQIDIELFNYLKEIEKENYCLLPVIINSNYDNVSQSFQIALNDALKRDNLDDIVPQSAFDVCVNLLDKWTSKDSIKDEILNKCSQITGTNIKKLRTGLLNYSPESYAQFVNLYNCVNIGLDFNPLVNNDVVKIYSDVSAQLHKFEYNGLFIIFDEFSKFIESNSSNLMKDLKIIQDMAELASRSSKNSQIHFCCVAHKSLGLYENSKNGNNQAFKTVEGRFKEIRFNRSLEENYQIISSAIKKTEQAKSLINSYINDNKDFYKQLLSLPIFNENSLTNSLLYGCFPLNPITAFSLIQISEYAAQNERTLFTFLSDTDDDSFNSFLQSNETGLFNVDKIYDYFSPLLQKEEANYIRNIWYRTESLLSKIENVIQRKIVKSLSIILMINDFDKLPATERVLSISLNIEESEIQKNVNQLIESHYLRRNILNNLLSFALSNTKEIDDQIELLKKTKFKNIRYSEVLNEINERRFVLPRKYNEENKITRFFKVSFFTEDDFLNIKSFDYYFENEFCDGLVIYLLKSKATNESIKNKINELNDKRIIVKYPKDKISDVYYQSIMRFACLNESKKQKGLDEITINEINLLLQETVNDVRSLTDKYFSENYSYFSILFENESFNLLLSKVMYNIFPIKIIFNNELINKSSVSSQYQKAINHVIDWLLNGKEDFSYSPTSPEMSIKMSIIDNNLQNDESSKNFKEIIENIKTKICDAQGKRITIFSIVNYLFKPPYGLRLGVIPVLFAKAISELSDNIVIYYSNKEIELNSLDLVKSITNEKYSLSFSKGSIEQKNYLKKLLKLFEVDMTDNFRKDTFLLANAIKKMFVGLPQIIRLSSIENNNIDLEEAMILYKNVFLSFNLNPYEAIYELPKKIFKSNRYEAIYEEIKYIVDNKDYLLAPYKQKMVNEIKSIYDINDNTSLKSGFNDFVKSQIKINEKPVLDTQYKSLFNAITMEFSYDDNEALELIAKIVTNTHIEDWNTDKSDELYSFVKDFKDKIINSNRIGNNNSISSVLDKEKELNGMAMLLKNNMESVLDEFSGSVSSEDKIAVLSSLLKDLL